MPELSLTKTSKSVKLKSIKEKSQIINETEKKVSKSIKLKSDTKDKKDKKGKKKSQNDTNTNNSDNDNSNSDSEPGELDDVAKKYQKKSQLEHIIDLPRYIYW